MPWFLPTMPLVAPILHPNVVLGLGRKCDDNVLNRNIAVTVMAMQDKGTSLSLDRTSAPPTPFVPSVTLLHHASPLKFYKVTEPNITKKTYAGPGIGAP